jgi:hypothetical protein
MTVTEHTSLADAPIDLVRFVFAYYAARARGVSVYSIIGG